MSTNDIVVNGIKNTILEPRTHYRLTSAEGKFQFSLNQNVKLDSGTICVHPEAQSKEGASFIFFTLRSPGEVQIYNSNLNSIYLDDYESDPFLISRNGMEVVKGTKFNLIFHDFYMEVLLIFEVLDNGKTIDVWYLFHDLTKK